MATALYRKSSNEVTDISIFDEPFADVDANYWGVATSVNLPDGNSPRDQSGATLGDLRVLGFAKIYVSGSNEARNATQQEIDTFAAAEAADKALQQRDAARELFENHPQWRKVFIAFADIIMGEINTLRQEITARHAQSDLPDRVLSQLRTAMRNRISESD